VFAVGGQASCFVLPAPTRGILARFLIKQTLGALDGYRFNIYDREDACRAVSEQSFNPDDEELGDRVMHTIIAEQVVAAGQHSSLLYGQVWPYENKSERSVTSMRRLGAIYLEIIAEAAEPSIPFEVAFTIAQPEIS